VKRQNSRTLFFLFFRIFHVVHSSRASSWRLKEKGKKYTNRDKVSVMFRTWDRMYYIRTIVPATSCGRSDRRMYLYISPRMPLLAVAGKSCDTREQGRPHPNYITVLWSPVAKIDVPKYVPKHPSLFENKFSFRRESFPMKIAYHCNHGKNIGASGQ